jgi:hypothetical protein
MAETPLPRKRRRTCCALLLALALAGGALVAWEAEGVPATEEGPAAAALAERVEAAVDLAAWQRTGAVAWTFAGIHEHLWDRRRKLARVVGGSRRVLLRLGDQSGRAWRDGEELEGEARDRALRWAWEQWCNDSFWLNPLAKLRDEGVTLSRCELGEGREGLLVRYASGGVSPGDAYLWTVNPEGLPESWKMWVGLIPVPGVDATWEGWTTLATGARVATQHRLILGVPLNLSQVEGATTLSDLEPGPDPFALLFD